MKTGLTIFKLIIMPCSVFATTAAFGQLANYTWTGAANGTNLDTPGNFTTNGIDPATTLPSGQDLSGIQESVIWDGRTTTNLNLTHAAAWPGTGLGSIGVNLILTANQTNDVQIISPNGSQINTFGITNNSANATFILGDNTAKQLEIITRPGIAGTVHRFVNNSANAAVINPSIQWLAGGGTACVFDFGGTGSWTVNNNLRDNNSGAGAITLVWDGPGTMTWSTGGVFVATVPLGPIVINSGTMILKSSGLALNFTGSGTVTNNNSITNNGTLQYDAAAQADTIARNISGTGQLKVSNGMLTLSGTNTYTGGTTISAVTLHVGTNGTSGSLGSGNVTNNGALVFNRSDNVTFTNAIGGTGSVVQKGSGTLTLNGLVLTYNGPTIVSNGTLVVSSVGGDMDVSGGTLAPAAAGTIGTLTVAGDMNISSGTVVAALNKSLSPSNTSYVVSGAINYTGGTLKLLNYGPALVNGDKFQIFNKAFAGSITVLSPGFTVVNNGDGSFTVQTVAPAGSDVITPNLSAGHLNLSWPSIWTGQFLQVQTNALATGLGTNWVTIPGTDAGNSYSTIPDNSNACVFYRLAP